jgi:hypothetical protein
MFDHCVRSCALACVSAPCGIVVYASLKEKPYHVCQFRLVTSIFCCCCTAVVMRLLISFFACMIMIRDNVDNR